MKKILLAFIAGVLCFSALAQDANFWTTVNEASIAKNVFANRYKPSAYQLFHLQEVNLVSELLTAPSERSVSPTVSSFVLSIPNADGQIEKYRVVEAPVMDPVLSSKYPGIKSYAGQGIDHPASSVRFDISPEGFHAMILSPTSIVGIERQRAIPRMRARIRFAWPRLFITDLW